MDNIKDDKYYIKKALESIDIIIHYTNNLTYKEFVENDILLDATMSCLVQMVEHLNHLSNEFKNNHTSIKWGLIFGFRNGVVHNYGNTDYTIVFDIIKKDIYKLKDELVSAL